MGLHAPSIPPSHVLLPFRSLALRRSLRLRLQHDIETRHSILSSRYAWRLDQCQSDQEPNQLGI